MNFNHGLNTRWANAIILFRLYCFEQMPFNGVEDIADEVLIPAHAYINDAAVVRAFSHHAVGVQRMRNVVQSMLLRYTVIETVPAPSSGPIHLSVDSYNAEMLSLVGWDSDGPEPYGSDSGSNTDSDMPPLIDVYDSDSGYGSD
ncbi:hypothetical protein C8J56DRAFT_888209 [Mycena floridula]|nr:hypothetical protein C8J56DRAFT_888209 [Mycena floridula]